MTKVIGVRFRTAGKIYFFSPGKFEVKRGDQVIVETARGVEFGNVVMGPKEVKDEELTQPLKTVIRLETEDDRRVEAKNRKKEKEAFELCNKKINIRGNCMTGEQLKLLTKMKKLITKGNKRFANRKDRDYLEELLEIGITESLAWQEILTLFSYNYVQDYKPFYSKSENSLVFKKDINGNRVYIKLKIEEYNNKEMTVCLSFHIDYK